MLISLPFDQGLNHCFYQHSEAFTSRLRKESFHCPLGDIKLQLGHWFSFRRRLLRHFQPTGTNGPFATRPPAAARRVYLQKKFYSEPDASPGRLVSRSDAPGCLEIIHRSLDCRDSQGACTLVEEAGRPNER